MFKFNGITIKNESQKSILKYIAFSLQGFEIVHILKKKKLMYQYCIIITSRYYQIFG